MIASIAIALISWGVNLINPIGVIWSVLAAFIATNLESVIGATLQSKYAWLTNEVVNIFNTFICAISAMIMALIYQSIFV
ncbi:MAG: DUF92 domain-containing protein, partial [Dolichospermum sp.]